MERIIVLGHGKILEAALLEVPAAATVVEFVIASNVRHAHPRWFDEREVERGTVCDY
ncbi:MAG: hypothetical protein GX594_11775 [Pirellulaceae bacterium]|nr:hypothetical protein [Pirellulaceae bacterium]